jgi:hypothetical protein
VRTLIFRIFCRNFESQAIILVNGVCCSTSRAEDRRDRPPLRPPFGVAALSDMLWQTDGHHSRFPNKQTYCGENPGTDGRIRGENPENPENPGTDGTFPEIFSGVLYYLIICPAWRA